MRDAGARRSHGPRRHVEDFERRWVPLGKRRSAVIIGAGARGNHIFAELMATRETGWEVAGVVEPNDARRESFRQRHGLPLDRTFTSVEQLLAGECIADFVFICTPDPTHFELCAAVSAKGYHVLLEKPIATSLPDCLALIDVQRTYGNHIFVAHVLRYSPFFRTLRQLISSGDYGTVRSLHMTEMIGHWHFAHSYVRGNWRRRADSAPIVLTKCSHDLDIMTWLLPGERVDAVSSVGSLSYFRPEMAPPEAALRCVDCVLQDTCLYSATELYVTDRHGWPYDVVAPGDNTLAGRRAAIATGPYGRCVWHSDNDVCDNQSVTLQFASGMHATLGLYAHTADVTRRITVLLDEAEINGDLHRGEIAVSCFTGEPGLLRPFAPALPAGDHHGGGDLALLRTLHEHLESGVHGEVMTSLATSVTSHVLAFLADDSRIQGGTPLPVPAVFEGASVNGPGERRAEER
jgi:predicted dehydrogenase